MWIILTSKQRIEVSGESRQYNPGDWVEIGKQTALLWVSQGNAKLPGSGELTEMNLVGAGVLTDHKELLCAHLKKYLAEIIIEEGAPCLPFEHTIWIDGLLLPRLELIPIGLSMLDVWDIAVPLQDYKRLAIHSGDETEKERTKSVIHDLRVPLYDTRLMFIKRTPETERLIDQWRDDGKTDLAFMRALYQHKPLILALPTTWTMGRVPKNE